MEEAAVAHQVTVLKQGKIVAQGTPDALKTKYAYDSMALVFIILRREQSFLRKMRSPTQRIKGYTPSV